MGAQGRRKRILVIEDNGALSKMLDRWLTFNGFDVRIEATGQAALSCAVDYKPDLVILDLRLPDISGYDVCHGLRQQFSPWELPIVMLTGMDRPVDQLRGFAHGADAYLIKPFDTAELVKILAILL